HVRRRPARRAVRRAGCGGAAARRAVANVDAQGELRLQGEALHARGASAPARAPPRLEGDLLRGRPRRADRARERLRSVADVSHPLRGDGRTRAGDAPAGRRLRPLPRRRPADEDRPCVDGVVARGARPVHGHGRRELRVLAAGAPQGARALEEAPAAARGRAAAAARGRPRSEARLLVSRSGVAARRARAVRPRHALGRHAPPPGLLPPRRGREADRRARRRPGGPVAAAVGAARVHTLARSARRRDPQGRFAGGRRMRVWCDFTASAHPLVFRPLVERLQAQGHEVEITARDYAQTLQLIESHGMTATVIGHHGGRSALGKARQMRSRLRALRAWARPRGFDLALAHGSHELTMTARRLGIPSSTTFDYEWAWLQHQLGCRAATRVVVPESIPPERLARYGAAPPKLLQYLGLKEEYYLADFQPDAAVLSELALDTGRVLVVLRPPPDVSLYHRHSNPLFPQTLRHLGALPDVHAVVLPRTEEQ